MGLIIGSAIFIVPATIAGRLHAMGPIVLVWVLGGFLTLIGALTLAELSAVLPSAGGPYAYLRHSFGRFWAFLFTWNHYFINTAGTIAAVSVAFATYLGSFIPALSPGNHFYSRAFSVAGHRLTFALGWTEVVAMALIAIVTLVNVRGVRFGGWVMNLLTATKILALLGLIVAAFVSGKGSSANLLPWWPEHWTHETTAAFGLSMIAVLWAFDGWISVTFTAGEMRDPERNIPRALIIGTVGVIALYLGANLAYAWVMPLNAMAGSPRVAADVARLVLGPVGATLVIVGILCSTVGTANGALLAIPRSIYGAAEDGAFPARFARVHPQFHTPAVAIATLGVWGGLLTLSGTYDQITSYVVFGSWFFYALTILSVIVLRRVMPEVPRRYKALGYPWAPLLFAAVAGWFLYNTVVEDPRSAAIGIGLLALGLPFYYRWKPR